MVRSQDKKKKMASEKSSEKYEADKLQCPDGVHSAEPPPSYESAIGVSRNSPLDSLVDPPRIGWNPDVTGFMDFPVSPNTSASNPYFYSGGGSVHIGIVSSMPGRSEQANEAFPTLFPANPFDPDKDCLLIKSFSKGIFGTDEKAVISVLGRRTLSQRWMVCEAYKQRFNKDLPTKLGSKLARAFFLRPVVYLAQDLKAAIHHTETTTTTNSDGSSSSHTESRPMFRDIIEMICSRTPQELKELTDEYNSMFKTTLQKDISRFISGKLKTLLSLLLTNTHSCVESIDRLQIDVQRLAQCDGSDEDKGFVITLLGTKSNEYLRSVAAEFKKYTSKDMAIFLSSNFSNYNKQAVEVMCCCLFDKPSYFANVLRAAVKGRDNITVMRIVVCGCEKDLAKIIPIYQQRYGKQFEESIIKHTSGATKHLLLALSGTPRR